MNVNIENEKNKSKTIKYIVNFLIFLFLIWLTFHILLREQNMGDLFMLIRHARVEFVLLGFLCMFFYFFFDAFNLRRTLKVLGEKCSLWKTLKYTLVGFFFSSITPAASGGQPMQIYLMHKDGVKVSSATLGLVINLFSFQCITIGMELVSVIFLHQYMDSRYYCFVCDWNPLKWFCPYFINNRNFFQEAFYGTS